MILVFFLIKIPIIGNIFTGIMGAEGGDPSRITSYAAVLFSYLLVSLLQDKIIGNDNTKTLTRKILGIFIVLWQIVTLVINIASGTDFASNILLIISGLLFFFWNN
jgi:succinate-acetate transporter protein